MKVVVDRARCTGLGICESFSPEHFEVDDSGELIVLRETVTDEEKDAVLAAIEACPTEALRLEP